MSFHYYLAAAMILTASAADANPDDPKSYSCNFDVGAAFSYANSAFKPEKVGPIAFDIGNINAEIQSADLVTPLGSRPLRVVRAVNALQLFAAGIVRKGLVKRDERATSVDFVRFVHSADRYLQFRGDFNI